MKDLLPFILVGLSTGSVYGLAAMGLVLTYRASGVFNFAHGAVGAVGAYLFWELWVHSGLPWWLAALITIVGGGVVLGGVVAVIAGRLSVVSTPMMIVGTVGLLLAVQALLVVRYGTVGITVNSYLPTNLFSVGGVNFGVDQVIVIAITVVVGVATWAMLRWSRLGTSMRAVVDNSELLALTGTNPVAVRVWSWIIGSMFALLSGVLLVPTIGLDPAVLTFVVIQALGAASFGKFTGLPLTYAGGLVIGVLASLATKYSADHTVLVGVPGAIPFVVLIVTLLVRRRTRATGYAESLHFNSRYGSRDPRVRWAGIVVAVVVAVVLPTFAGTDLPVYTTAVIFVLLFLSVGFILRMSGQISLCHISFAAVGAAAYGHFSNDGVPAVIALVIAAVLTGVVGAVVAFPALRLSGRYLALATFGFGLLVQQLLYPTQLMFTSSYLTIKRPKWSVIDFGTDKGYYYLCLFVVAVCAGLLLLFQRMRLGRLALAMTDSPVALASFGVNNALLRISVFSISSAVAGIAGALLVAQGGSASGTQFDPMTSLLLLAVLAIQPQGTLASAVFAGVALKVIPSWLPTTTVVTNWITVLFGATAILVALTSGTAERPSILRVLEARFGGGRGGPGPERGQDELVGAGGGGGFEDASGVGQGRLVSQQPLEVER